MATIIEQLMKITDDINAGKSVNNIFSEQKRGLSGKKLNEKYYLIQQLSDQIGPLKPRLDLIYRLVKMPSFVYDKNQNSLPFLESLTASSYWLDQELFDTTAINQRIQSAKTTECYAHIKLLEIGSALLDKGFPLNQEALSVALKNKKTPLYSWAKTFLEQCHKRNAFLKRKRITRHRTATGPEYPLKERG